MPFTAKEIYDLNNSMSAAQKVDLGTVVSALVDSVANLNTTNTNLAFYGDSLIVTLAQATASKVEVTMEHDISWYQVQVLKNTGIVGTDPKVTTTASKLIIENGGSYVVEEDDQITYIVW